MHEKYARQSIYVRKKSGMLLRVVISPHSLPPASERVFCARKVAQCVKCAGSY
nr:MAG TPA: hypothetical protein [Caudoviricetes sp.]